MNPLPGCPHSIFSKSHQWHNRMYLSLYKRVALHTFKCVYWSMVKDYRNNDHAVSLETKFIHTFIMTWRTAYVYWCVVPMCLQASPMKLSYSTQWEQYLTQEIVDEMVGGACCYWIPSCVYMQNMQSIFIAFLVPYSAKCSRHLYFVDFASKSISLHNFRRITTYRKLRL